MKHTLPVALLVLAPTTALADAPTTTLMQQVDEPRAESSAYLEVVSLVLSNAVSINVDHRFDDHWGIRAGWSGSMIFFPAADGGSAQGPLVMGTFMAGNGPVKFEADLGLSLVQVSGIEPPWDLEVADGLFVVPNGFVGMRVSPVDGGFLFRAGGTLVGGFGFGGSLSFGATF